MSTLTPNLTYDARRILRQNDTGKFIKPSPKQYPHQWNWDAALIAIGLATFDLPRARTEVRSLLEGQWSNGMVPHILYHDGPSDYFPTPDFWQSGRSPYAPKITTSGLTQPPVLATAVRAIFNKDPSDLANVAFVREVYPKLLAWHRWFHKARDPKHSGLVAIMHPWESGMDNSTRWTDPLGRLEPCDIPSFARRDQEYVVTAERPTTSDYDRFMYLIGQYRAAAWDSRTLAETAPFYVQDTFTSALLHRADEDLLALAQQLGEPTAELLQWRHQTQHGFDTRLWDERDSLYYDFDLRTGQSVKENTCATFIPLFAGLASERQAARLVEEHLLNPAEYAPGSSSRYYLPSAAKNSPYFEARRYWRGPIWLNINWLVIQGLLRYGYYDVASTISAHTLELVREGFAEYFDPTDGTPCGAQNFSWSAALVLELNGTENQRLEGTSEA